MKGFCILLVLALVGCRTNVTPEQQAKDAQILTEVKARLAQQMGVSTLTNVSVNVTNGVVTLSGQVGNAERKAQAETVARSVANVVRVNNELQVAATG
ncbi:MAG: BON domain-containing protein [Acidobacteria bacterium]|nr:BON domain-containing protein [Acidobacteriota bacterium]